MAGAIVAHASNEQLNGLLDLELRHIEASKLTKLSTIIDRAKAWGTLLEELTREDPVHSTRPDTRFGRRENRPNLNLTLNTINLIENQIYCGKSPSMALLNHWAITGRRRPTVRILLSYLNLCQLKWAEDYVCQHILGIKFLEPPATQNSSLMTAIHSADYKIDDIFKFDNLKEIVDNLDSHSLIYSFKSLYCATGGFSDIPFDFRKRNGFKIGEGRFSSVYRATEGLRDDDSDRLDDVVAVKLLKSACNKNYLTNEINLMKKVRHESILELISIAWESSSINTSEGYICLVYRYMQNGSLYDCLSSGLATRNMDYLKWNERFQIAIMVAEGISFFHNFYDGPIIHRDIKTANIFIDSDLKPNLGDFTLVRQLDQERSTNTQFSQNVIGTSVYMPPEAFRGDISTKFDIFSFGVVLLELLTGLKPFDAEQNEDLLTHISEKLSDINDELEEDETGNDLPNLKQKAKDRFLNEILDKKAGAWDFQTAKILFDIALQATESRKKSRPEISVILPLLKSHMQKI